MIRSAYPRAATIALTVRECLWTEDAAAFRAYLTEVPDEDWRFFEEQLQGALTWRARHPPLRQVKLARLRDESDRRRGIY